MRCRSGGKNLFNFAGVFILSGYEKRRCDYGEEYASIRPGIGLSPRYYDAVLGKKGNRDIKRGTALGWNMINA